MHFCTGFGCLLARELLHIDQILNVLYNLHITVTLLGGPSPTLVCALSCNTYIVSGDNPSTVNISTLLLKLVIVGPFWSE